MRSWAGLLQTRLTHKFQITLYYVQVVVDVPAEAEVELLIIIDIVVVNDKKYHWEQLVTSKFIIERLTSGAPKKIPVQNYCMLFL